MHHMVIADAVHNVSSVSSEQYVRDIRERMMYEQTYLGRCGSLAWDMKYAAHNCCLPSNRYHFSKVILHGIKKYSTVLDDAHPTTKGCLLKDKR